MFEYISTIKGENEITVHLLFDECEDVYKQLNEDLINYDIENYSIFQKKLNEFLDICENLIHHNNDFFENLIGNKFLINEVEDIKNNPISIVRKDDRTIFITNEKYSNGMTTYSRKDFYDDPSVHDDDIYFNGKLEMQMKPFYLYYETKNFKVNIIEDGYQSIE